MNPLILRWLIFAVLMFLAPVPYFLVEMGRVPPARLLQLTGYLLALIVAEGGQGAVVQAALLIGAQAFGYTVAVFVLADALARRLARMRPPVATAVTVGVISCAVVCSLLMRPYSTPFRIEASENGLIGVYR